MKGLQNRLGFNLLFKFNLKAFTNLNTRSSIRYQSKSFNSNTLKLISKPYSNQYSFYKVSAITCTSFLLLLVYEYSHDIIGNESILERFNVNQPTLFPKPNSETYIRGIYEQSLIEEELDEEMVRDKLVNHYAKKLQQKNLSTIQRLCYRIMYSYCKVVRISSYAFTNYLKEPFFVTKRTLQIMFLIMIPLLFHYKFSSTHERFLQHLIRIIESKGGPTFVKLAQWASSRTDLFSQDTCDQLGKLHSMNKNHSMKDTMLILSDKENNEYNIDDLFKTTISNNSMFNNMSQSDINDDMILGSGAIGQVYKIDHMENNKNKPIAIKIIHPRVREYIARDLAIMKFFGNLLNRIPNWEWLSIPEEVEQFSVFLKSQLDFRIEACNMIKFDELFSDNKSVYFPNIYTSHRDYLIEELVDGVSLSDVLKLKQKLIHKPGYSDIQFYFKDISNIFVQSFLDMLILKNFIHADLHPGNIIVTLDKNNNEFKKYVKNLDNADAKTFHKIFKNQKIVLNYIDTGLSIQLSPTNRINFINLFEQLCDYNGVKIGNLLIERSKTPETVIHRSDFIEQCDKMMKNVAKQEFTLGNFSIGELLNEMMSLVRSHHIKLESEFVGVIVGLFIIEGVSKSLDKDIKFFEEFVKFLVVNC
ncbi:uncharacterized protein HGUI_03204 [Hanseniaspora guilliermondii]|uniref:Protein kinase domain-containing protein n=1 Tax=Hanseniaspora guilliermondii TaxID=56406 RepID=A0A1L0B5A0_9ASCO|nr:uncharacterized protein HGUI_03204 [Hanseniaspora guilliermondii]